MAERVGAPLPLSDVRIAVKDIFDICGIRTSLGSRDYLRSGSPALKTSPAVQLLVDSGANIVGLTKICSMVLLQHPTQCIDFSAPFNPRGDGYQSPSGGSSGQAAAVSSYAWLDAAISSDSTASARLPAIANGCFSYRPSVGIASCEGMWSGVPMVDTPCVFSRSINTITKLATEWAQQGRGSPQKLGELPPYLLFITDPLGPEESLQKDIAISFLRDVERFLGIPAKQLSVPDAWNNDPPIEALGLSISEYLDANVATRTYVYTFWKRIQIFLSEFEAQQHRMPYIPPPKGIRMWDGARKVKPEEHQESMVRWNVFRNWLLDKVLCVRKMNTLLVWPITEVQTRYRDEWPSPPLGDQSIWEPLLISPITGSPEVIVPVGEVPYNSRVSGKEEMLPVCVSVMGVPHSDLNLLETVQKILEGSNRWTTVGTGRSMFLNHDSIDQEGNQQDVRT
ncbi:putative glutamyl-tRNA amidotransferase subunit A [Rosellinia necatrix]|uniref:Putative glutamyl-tRNA amidotransferase subunit A n=1 Tax=Rosellinia necatrix TaxID=77044 RepID=A0A1W2TAL5_ROSNE|nr:putative glutamyl-tRNA amidotransferase subunit A [Rosellinia necatrix]